MRLLILFYLIALLNHPAHTQEIVGTALTWQNVVIRSLPRKSTSYYKELIMEDVFKLNWPLRQPFPSIDLYQPWLPPINWSISPPRIHRNEVPGLANGGPTLAILQKAFGSQVHLPDRCKKAIPKPGVDLGSKDRATFVENCFACTNSPCVGSKLPISVLNNLGIFFSTNSFSVFCSGIVVGPKSVLTARHCLLDSEIHGSQSNYRFIDALGNVSKLARPAFPAKSKELYKSLYSDGQARYDYAIVALEKPLTHHYSGWRSNAQRKARQGMKFLGAQLMIPAFSASLSWYHWGPLERRSIAHVRKKWTYFIRVDSKDTCRVFSRSDSTCIQYACQTEQTASGSPVFAVSADRLVLVGVHRGVVDGTNCGIERSKMAGLTVRIAGTKGREILSERSNRWRELDISIPNGGNLVTADELIKLIEETQ